MQDPNGISTSSFCGTNGGTEHFISVTPPSDASFEDQIAYVDTHYRETVAALGLEPETAIFRRLFLSDVINQTPQIVESGIARNPEEGPVAVSIVQQQPLPGSKISVLAYHLESEKPVAKKRLSNKHVMIEKNGLRHLWSTRLCASDDHGSYCAEDQTRQVFDDLIGTIESEGGKLREDCVRTWIYVKDVDVFYQPMVDSRRELFSKQGMNGNSHYIASTGIEGACAHRHDLVAMDAYSVLGLGANQVSYLNDFDRLCPTKDYDVTFERGTRVAYADRSHHFISGTASIDREGQVLHRGNVMRQLDRALENINALLMSGDASLEDMKYLIVYLRDPTDHQKISEYLSRQIPNIPALIVEGAVCRPEWLVEIEGVGVAPNEDPTLHAF